MNDAFWLAAGVAAAGCYLAIGAAHALNRQRRAEAARADHAAWLACDAARRAAAAPRDDELPWAEELPGD